MDPDERPLTDLERLQLQANAVTDASLESTRRMRQMVEESETTGGKTLEALHHQGEQLNNAERGLDAMNAELKQAEKHITSMEKWCGLCVCPWNRHPRVRDTDGKWEPDSSKKGAVTKQPGAKKVDNGSTPSGPYIQRITNDAREDEMEENMQEVGARLGVLKNMAADMNVEIGKQNEQIDRMKGKSEHMNARVDNLNKRTDKLLK